MQTVHVNNHLLVLKDHLAVDRGTWVVFGAACESVRLLQQGRAFASHRRVHGWPVTHALVP